MNHDWQSDLRQRSRTAATSLPPATVEETAWDILLALHSDDRCELTLEKLACVVSVGEQALNQRLVLLEERQLIAGVTNEVTQELRASLTQAGRDLLDRYLSVTTDLQCGGHR
jgi:hypothetical protein